MSEIKDYALKPAEIKKVVVIGHSGLGTQSFDSLLEAITAVYHLTPIVRDHVADIVTRTSELNQRK